MFCSVSQRSNSKSLHVRYTTGLRFEVLHSNQKSVVMTISNHKNDHPPLYYLIMTPLYTYLYYLIIFNGPNHFGEEAKHF